ncbi:MAG TPA: hypothetical protein PL048_25085 [Leptospiraceae bacterium]|nr:hypothetical protein [Leptospiraceae bacterium]
MAKSAKGKKKTSPMMIGDAELYQVQYNGGRPYTVLVSRTAKGGKQVKVYRTRQVFNEEWDMDVDAPSDVYEDVPPKPKELLFTWKNPLNLWIAKCPSLYADEAESLGNSILLEIAPEKEKGPRTYIHIGPNVCRFTSKDPIIEYESPIDNNNVPYPAAASSKEVFFLGEMLRLSREYVKEPVLGRDSGDLKKLPKDVLKWVCIYENLYGTEKERKKWNAQGLYNHPEAKKLQGYKELASSDS